MASMIQLTFWHFFGGLRAAWAQRPKSLGQRQITGSQNNSRQLPRLLSGMLFYCFGFWAPTPLSLRPTSISTAKKGSVKGPWY